MFQVDIHLLTDLTESLNLEYNLKSKYINFDEMEILMKEMKRSWMKKQKVRGHGNGRRWHLVKTLPAVYTLTS